MRQAAIVVAASLAMVAMIAASCSDGQSGNSLERTGTPTSNRSVAVTVTKAEEILGFKIILPTYIPEGLEAPFKVFAHSFQGEPLQASISYSRPQEIPSVASSMLILESNLPPADGFGLGEPNQVGDTTVYVDVGDDDVHAEWLQGGIQMSVSLFASDEGPPQTELLQAEVLLVAQSMIGE